MCYGCEIRLAAFAIAAIVVFVLIVIEHLRE